MALKTSVKVGRITNLSDARYCSGMGVEYLGFRTISKDAFYIDTEKFQSIVAWISGPKIIAEIYGLERIDQLNQIITNYQPSMLELSLKEFMIIEPFPLPVFLQLTEEELQNNKALLNNRKHEIQHLIFSADVSSEFLLNLTKSYKVLLKLTGSFDPDILRLPISGITMDGTDEVMPGLKDYESLSEILEILEED